MECRLAGETEVLGENLPQRHFCPSQNPTCLGPVSNPGPSHCFTRETFLQLNRTHRLHTRSNIVHLQFPRKYLRCVNAARCPHRTYSHPPWTRCNAYQGSFTGYKVWCDIILAWCFITHGKNFTFYLFL
jgi:hypothetical protein